MPDPQTGDETFYYPNLIITRGRRPVKGATIVFRLKRSPPFCAPFVVWETLDLAGPYIRKGDVHMSSRDFCRTRIAVSATLLLFGCRHRASIEPIPRPVARAAPAEHPRAWPLSLDATQGDLAAWIVEYYRKPVMGRRGSLRDVERIVRDVAPLVVQAAQQAAIAEPLRRMAAD